MDGKTLVGAFVALAALKAGLSALAGWIYFHRKVSALKAERRGRIRISLRRYVAADATLVSMAALVFLVIAEVAIMGAANLP